MSVFDFLSVKKTINDAAAQLKVLREKSDGIRAQCAVINAGAAAKSDVRAAVDKWVDDMAAGFTQLLQSRMRGLTQDARSLANARFINHVMSLIGEPSSREETPTHQINQVLCGLFGAQVKTALAKVIDSMKWAEGLPLAERPAALARLGSELEQAMAEESELTAAAKEAGVPLAGQRII